MRAVSLTNRSCQWRECCLTIRCCQRLPVSNCCRKANTHRPLPLHKTRWICQTLRRLPNLNHLAGYPFLVALPRLQLTVLSLPDLVDDILFIRLFLFHLLPSTYWSNSQRGKKASRSSHLRQSVQSSPSPQLPPLLELLAGEYKSGGGPLSITLFGCQQGLPSHYIEQNPRSETHYCRRM
jgi:hypothetical protein